MRAKTIRTQVRNDSRDDADERCDIADADADESRDDADADADER
jgi:hypothetical protein